MIWAGAFEPHGANQQFFVGTEQQWREADGREGSIPDGPLDPKTLLPIKQMHKGLSELNKQQDKLLHTASLMVLRMRRFEIGRFDSKFGEEVLKSSSTSSNLIRN